jgi:hypothetical protein
MAITATDTIHFHSISTGSNVGNGGNGYFDGYISNNPVFTATQSNSAGSTNTVDGHHVDSDIDADTHATQTNTISHVDQSQNVMLGLGGNGGNGNVIMDSGNVSFHLDTDIHA